MKLSNCIEKYKVYELLGKGGFAEVYRALEFDSGQEVALKKICKRSMRKKGMQNRVRQELEIHAALEHPSIVKLYTCFQDEDYIYLALELCPNGDLFSELKSRNSPFSEKQARGVLKQVLAALKYLHSHRIIHRDITLANLLLTRDYRVKIADFGLAVKTQQNEKHKTMCGTPNYIAPEIVTRQDQGPEIDIWNAGILMYTLLVGTPPFDTDAIDGGIKTTLKKVVTEEIKWPCNLSREVVHLLNFMLKKDPKERITLNEILSHSFMLETSCEDLRLLTPSSSAYNDSGFMTRSSASWLTAGEHVTKNNTPIPYKVLPQLLPANHQHLSSISKGTSYHSAPLQADHSCSQVSAMYSCQPCQDSNLNLQLVHIFGDHVSEKICPDEVVSAPNISIRYLQPDQVPVPPLNTVRLRPKWREKGKSVYFSILECGSVCLEVLKERGNMRKIVQVIVISRDGLEISLQQPYPESNPPGSGSTVTMYSYTDLPESFLKKYMYALKYANNEKSVTSKIIYYSPLAKCHLMENGPEANFTMHFYSGGKILKKRSQVEILDKNYKLVSSHALDYSGQGLSSEWKRLWDHFKLCLQECLTKEQDLEELSLKRPEMTWFPNTSGSKPHTKWSASEIKENITPGYPNTAPSGIFSSAPSSIIGRPASLQSAAKKSRALKQACIASIGTAYQLANGSIKIDFADSSKLQVLPIPSRQMTLFEYTDGNGRRSEYEVAEFTSFEFPQEVRLKMSQYRNLVEKLKNTL